MFNLCKCSVKGETCVLTHIQVAVGDWTNCFHGPDTNVEKAI